MSVHAVENRDAILAPPATGRARELPEIDVAEMARPGRITVIIAPRGWGKTTLAGAIVRAACATADGGVAMGYASRKAVLGESLPSYLVSDAYDARLGRAVLDEAEEARAEGRSQHLVVLMDDAEPESEKCRDRIVRRLYADSDYLGITFVNAVQSWQQVRFGMRNCIDYIAIGSPWVGHHEILYKHFGGFPDVASFEEAIPSEPGSFLVLARGSESSGFERVPFRCRVSIQPSCMPTVGKPQVWDALWYRVFMNVGKASAESRGDPIATASPQRPILSGAGRSDNSCENAADSLSAH